MSYMVRPRLHFQHSKRHHEDRIRHCRIGTHCNRCLCCIQHLPVRKQKSQDNICNSCHCCLCRSHSEIFTVAIRIVGISTRVPTVQPVLRRRTDTIFNSPILHVGQERQRAFGTEKDWHGHGSGSIRIFDNGSSIIQPCKPGRFEIHGRRQ